MEENSAELESGPLGRIARACDRLKVFPLPGAVVFPGTPSAFHVFEPRYRALVADALAGDRVLAVATLVSPDDAPRSRAPLHPVAGVGVIEHEERLPDGNYDIVLRALARVRLVAEHDQGKPYREFKAELLRDVEPPVASRAAEARRAALEATLFQLSGVLPSGSKARWLAKIASRIPSPSMLADVAAAAVLTQPLRRLAALEELDVAKRLDLVTGEIAGLVQILSQGPSPTA